MKVLCRSVLLILALAAFAPEASAQMSFGVAASPAVAAAPQSVVVGDFNGDGKQDLARIIHESRWLCRRSLFWAG